MTLPTKTCVEKAKVHESIWPRLLQRGLARLYPS